MGRLFLTDDGRRLSLSADLRHRIGAGGQGRVFRAQLGCDFVAVKLLRHASQAKLVALQSLEPSCRAVATLPVHLLFDGAGSQVVGYAMRCIDPAKSISAARLFNFQEICQLEHYSWADAVLFAKRLAEAVASLHRLGVVIGDLNPENVFFERSGEASLGSWRAIVIDTDSFQLTDGHGSRHLCPVARPAYTAPELVGTDFSACWRQTSSDNFALAVLIYQLLLHDHPYDNADHAEGQELAVTTKIRRGFYPHAPWPHAGVRASRYRPGPAQVSEAIDRAFQRSFRAEEDLPVQGLRPTAWEWAQLLEQLHQELVPCSRSRHHHHPKNQNCLWCDLDQRLGQPLSRFPNTAERSPVPKGNGVSNAVKSAVAPSRLPRDLYEKLSEHHRHYEQLLGLRRELGEQLLEQETRLGKLSAQGRLEKDALDLGALEARLSSVRARVSRWLGRQAKAQKRQAALLQLRQWSGSRAELMVKTLDRLKQHQRQLLLALGRIETSDLDQLPLPTDALQLWKRQLDAEQARKNKLWLNEKLCEHKLEAWPTEGIGRARFELLARQGVLTAADLQAQMHRLTDFEGIGKITQRKLRERLHALIQELRRQQPKPLGAIRIEQLLKPELSAALDQLEITLNDLQGPIAANGQELGAAEQSLQTCSRRGQQLLASYQALW